MLKIAITGPESTGKSRLAEELARVFHTQWVPEYARVYLNQIERPYNQEDILIIAQEQFRLEREAAHRNHDLIFVDTEFLVTKIWSEYVYGVCPDWINNQFHQHRYDLYLLCDIDLPWEYDPLREHPGEGRFFLDWFTRELSENQLPFELIRGTGEERTRNALNLLTRHFPELRQQSGLSLRLD